MDVGAVGLSAGLKKKNSHPEGGKGRLILLSLEPSSTRPRHARMLVEAEINCFFSHPLGLGVDEAKILAGRPGPMAGD